MAGLQGFEVVLQEHLQVLIIEPLQPPLRPEERLKVIQRGIGRPHHEGIAPSQALLEETVNLGIPAPLKLTKGFDVEHLRRLISQFPDLVVDRLGQTGGYALQSADRIMLCHRERRCAAWSAALPLSGLSCTAFA